MKQLKVHYYYTQLNFISL